MPGTVTVGTAVIMVVVVSPPQPSLTSFSFAILPCQLGGGSDCFVGERRPVEPVRLFVRQPERSQMPQRLASSMARIVPTGVAKSAWASVLSPDRFACLHPECSFGGRYLLSR